MDRVITAARLVKRVLKELKFINPATVAPRTRRPSKADQRGLIANAVGELLLLSQNAARLVLTAKLEALHHQIHSILGTKR
jgi:hypothetical protein